MESGEKQPIETDVERDYQNILDIAERARETYRLVFDYHILSSSRPKEDFFGGKLTLGSLLKQPRYTSDTQERMAKVQLDVLRKILGENATFLDMTPNDIARKLENRNWGPDDPNHHVRLVPNRSFLLVLDTPVGGLHYELRVKGGGSNVSMEHKITNSPKYSVIE